MKNEEWRMENGEWRMENEEWRMALLCRSPTEQRPSVYPHLHLLPNMIKKVSGNEEWRLKNEEWIIKNAEWRIKNVEGRMKGKKPYRAKPLCKTPTEQSASATSLQSNDPL